jgi:two-component system, response regulator, stage 0 sporulation protein F
MNEIMTAQELSAYLKITTTTIYKLAQQGEVPAFKIGSEWRFKKDLVDRWLERGAGLGVRKVLVVDDEPGICEMYRKGLDRKKFQVEAAHSGEEALQALRNSNYDLVFLDLKMPGMNGVETFREIKKLSIKALVVISTAYPDSELLSEAMKLGPLTVVLKPFDLNEIQRSVESLVPMTSKS